MPANKTMGVTEANAKKHAVGLDPVAETESLRDSSCAKILPVDTTRSLR